MASPTYSSVSLAAELFTEEPAPFDLSIPSGAVDTAAELDHGAHGAEIVNAPSLLRTLEDFEGLRRGPVIDPRAREWSFEGLSGRLCELHSTGTAPLLSAAIALVLAAQQQAQPTAWVAAGSSSFHPPDVAAWGVDLCALAVVRVPDARGATRAADTLLRSGAFGLVVLDLGADVQVPVSAQTRLTGLVKRHQAVLLVLTRSQARRRVSSSAGGALGSLVSLRAGGRIERTRRSRFRCVVEVTKDKLHGPGWRHEEICHGPDGLC